MSGTGGEEPEGLGAPALAAAVAAQQLVAVPPALLAQPSGPNYLEGVSYYCQVRRTYRKLAQQGVCGVRDSFAPTPARRAAAVPGQMHRAPPCARCLPAPAASSTPRHPDLAVFLSPAPTHARRRVCWARAPLGACSKRWICGPPLRPLKLPSSCCRAATL